MGYGRALKQAIKNREAYMGQVTGNGSHVPMGAPSADWLKWIEWRNARRGDFDRAIRSLMDTERQLRRSKHEYPKQSARPDK